MSREVSAAMNTGKVKWVDFHRHTAAGEIFFSLLVPVYAEQSHRPLGTLVLLIDPRQSLYPYLQEWPIPSSSAETMLVRREGNEALIISELRFQSDAAFNLAIPLENEQSPAAQAVLGYEGIMEGIDYRGVPVIACVRAVPDSPWYLVAKVDIAEAHAPLQERVRQTVAFFGLLAGSSSVGLLLVWRWQRERYYRQEAKAALALREANRRLSELNRLGLALAQTLDAPAVYRVAYEHMSQLVDCPCFGISLYDPATQTLRAAYMVSDDELLDTADFPPLTIPIDQPLKGRARAIVTQQPEIVESMPAPSGQAIIVGTSNAGRIPRSAMYVPMVAHGQTLGLLEVQSYRENAYSEADAVLLGPAANQIGLAIVNARLFSDLQAERDLLAQRVRERTAELMAANRELEAFVYSVSHDLRAPLRALDGFSEALLSRCQAQLDEEGRHYVERIQAASQRMGQLINDLLALSRVTRHEMVYQTVDLTALAREVAADLQAQDPHRAVELVIAEGMVAYGDAPLLRILLENLLGNAWKFTAKADHAVIEVGMLKESGEQEDASRVYFVRDNGVGFDMAYADKLFTPFQRLHSMHEFPGTGIGLATVQRIVARHGGRVWAEAAVNQGATFYFTLPWL